MVDSTIHASAPEQSAISFCQCVAPSKPIPFRVYGLTPTPRPECPSSLQPASCCYRDHAHHILAPPVSAVHFRPALLFLGEAGDRPVQPAGRQLPAKSAMCCPDQKDRASDTL